MSVTSTKSSPAPPTPFIITDSTQLDDWKKWQRSFRYYANAINLDQKSHDYQLSTFKSLIGPDGLEIYNTFSILEITDVESVIRKFDDHFKPKVNVTVERYKLYKLNQKSGQRFDDFLADITNQVDKCGFRSMRDEIVLYKIVGGIENDAVRKALLADADLKYDKAVRICRVSSTQHFMSGKENVRKGTNAKKESELSKTQLVSHKKVKAISRGCSKEDKKEPRTKKVETSTVVQKRSDTKKILDKRIATEKLLEENISVEKDSKLFDSEENENKDGGSDGGDSDWRGDDDCNDDDDDDDDDDFETSFETVTRRQGSKKRTAQKSGVSSETPVKVKSFPCGICGRGVGSKPDLKRHIMTHLQVGKLTCHHCGGQFKQKRYILRHMVRSHPDIVGSVTPKVYTCDVCGYKTNQGANMRRHKYQHTEDRPFSCELCEYRCIVPRLMRAHMAKHTGERRFTCSVCPKGFMESGALKKHMLTHMTPEEREKYLAEEGRSLSRSVEHTCETCGKVFSSKGALKTHLVTHTGERPFACTVCDYRAGQKAALNAHMVKHSEDKPFVCTVCGYSCKLKRILQTHMHTHTGDRPYACKMCESKFKQIAHLTVHMRTHTGEKPYVCDICGHRWAKQSNLTQHMKVHQNQTGDPTQYTPPRKRQKKRKIEAPSNDPAPPPANAIPQWSEQVSTINPMECFLNLETPPPFHPPYPVPQGNPRPPDCRYFQQRQ